jgi:Ca2+-binding RTX toxin-like protein
MTRIRLLTLPVVLVLVGLVAAPAQATLLVRSDGAGLLVQDKNGLSDDVAIQPREGGYGIFNDNLADLFKFDYQTGCESRANGVSAYCDRNGPKMRVLLATGDDELTMNLAPTGESSVDGGSGDDKIIGNPGPDEVLAGLGEDKLQGREGNDVLVGEENRDRLEGQEGDDTLKGEGNSDVLIGGLGADVLRGGASDDFMDAREPDGSAPVADGVDCGNGLDTVDADLKDRVQADCEDIDRRPVGETPNVDIRGKTLRVSRTGKVRVRLRCPRGVKRLGCKGRLQLKIDRRASSSRSRKVRYKIKAGRRKTVTLQLTRGDVRSLRSRQRRGRKTRGILTSVEKGRKGRKTTIRNPRLRLR